MNELLTFEKQIVGAFIAGLSDGRAYGAPSMKVVEALARGLGRTLTDEEVAEMIRVWDREVKAWARARAALAPVERAAKTPSVSVHMLTESVVGVGVLEAYGLTVFDTAVARRFPAELVRVADAADVMMAKRAEDRSSADPG